MTTLGLLAEPLAAAEVFNRRNPPQSFVALLAGWLRGAKRTALEVADAALMPEWERIERERAER